MKTRFVKDHIDGMTFSNLSNEDKELLKKCGYTEDKQGEVYAIFKFGDGIAFVPNHCGLVLRYPTLVEVAQSEKMQREIAAYTCRPDITPYDIALKYGRLGKYKYAMDYDEWYGDEDVDPTARQEVWTLYVRKDENDYGHIAFDVFDDEYAEMEKQGLISASETEDGHYLEGFPTKEQIEQMEEKYGILWTEWVGDHVYDERGYLQKYVEVELTSAEKVVKMAEKIMAMGGTMVIWNDKEFHFASQSGWQYRTAHGEMWVKEVKPSELIVTDGEKNWEIPMWMMSEKMMHQVFMTFKAVCKRNLTDIGYKRVMSAIGE